MVCGWMRYAALPPAFTRGVVPVRTLVPGGVRHPHPFHKKCEEWNCKHRKINYWTLSELRTPPVPALAQGHFTHGMIAPGNHWHFESLRAAPPSQVRGARPRTASTRTPFNKQLYKFQFAPPLRETDTHILYSASMVDTPRVISSSTSSSTLTVSSEVNMVTLLSTAARRISEPSEWDAPGALTSMVLMT